MSEAVRLTVPRERPYERVVHLVLGGVAARQDLPLDALGDLQVALDELLEGEAYSTGSDVTVEIAVEGGALEVSVGPLDAQALERELGASADAARGVGLARLLETLTGGFEAERRDGAQWLRLRKELPAGEAR